ncbi:MAG: hypothetical protein JSS75_08420 [Bacteroidetes bacterium]|nr:hypothetical protein [Bacteroidota bacterium]
MKKLIPILTLAATLGVTSCSKKAMEGDAEPGVPSELATPAEFVSTIPSDIDTSLQNQYMANHEIAKSQRLHDLFSWRSFLAINWPVDAKGDPQPKLTDAGQPRWTGWSEAFNVFRDSGQHPLPWGANRLPPSWIVKGLQRKQLNASADGAHRRILFLNNKTLPIHGKQTVANEVDQAFTGPMFDQNGNLVRYEVLLNKQEYDYIVANELYNWDGQIVFSSKHDSLADFPSGIFQDKDSVGAIEIKLAWKVLDPKKDIASRYFSMDAYVYNLDSTWSDVKVGLVGMHISHKCASGKQWLWSTFEQVDNVEVNELAAETDSSKLPKKPSFYDPNCPSCPVNVFVDSTQIPYTNPAEYIKYSIPKDKYIPNGGGAFIAQAQRVIPIPKALQELNHRIQKMLAAQGSVWQYYELIGTQWPKHQFVPPAPNTYAALPRSVDNKPGGDPEPVFLTNMTMETYFQLGNQSASNMIENANAPANVSQERYVFGTESCMGCHSSAGLAVGKDSSGNPIFAPQLSADFSWLLNTKATWKR